MKRINHTIHRPMNILLLSDIHGNFPALAAIEDAVRGLEFSHVLNCGDCTVYAPFANETMAWLRQHRAISIRGNTDDRILRLLTGKSFKKPANPERRCMYTSTFAALESAAQKDLLALRKKESLNVSSRRIGLYHGSPEDHEEFLFNDTPDKRFAALAKTCGQDIVITGHSHSPYHKYIGGVHFINPGSVGRMFDGDPRTSFAVLELGEDKDAIQVRHHRLDYDIEKVAAELKRQNLPDIYAEMFRQGRKLN